MAEFECNAKITMRVTVNIVADSPEEAEQLFDAGAFDWNLNEAEMVDWEATGKAKEVA